MQVIYSDKFEKGVRLILGDIIIVGTGPSYVLKGATTLKEVI